MKSAPPELVVQRQLDAYNAHDMETFLATYHGSARIFSFPQGELLMEGHEEMRNGYRSRFADGSPVHARVVKRIVEGRFVIDAEAITGLLPKGELRATLIFEVEDGLIQQVWILRDSP